MSGREKSEFGELTGYDETVARETGFDPRLVLTEVRCEECGRADPRTRTYSLVYIVFLLVFFLVRFDSYFKCPRCMRAHLLMRVPLAALLANVLAPLVLLWWLVLFLRTLLVR